MFCSPASLSPPCLLFFSFPFPSLWCPLSSLQEAPSYRPQTSPLFPSRSPAGENQPLPPSLPFLRPVLRHPVSRSSPEKSSSTVSCLKPLPLYSVASPEFRFCPFSSFPIPINNYDLPSEFPPPPLQPVPNQISRLSGKALPSPPSTIFPAMSQECIIPFFEDFSPPLSSFLKLPTS